MGFTFAAVAVYVDAGQRNGDSFLTVALMEAAIGVPIIGLIMILFFCPYRPQRLKNLAALDRFLPGRPRLRLWGKRAAAS